MAGTIYIDNILPALRALGHVHFHIDDLCRNIKVTFEQTKPMWNYFNAIVAFNDDRLENYYGMGYDPQRKLNLRDLLLIDLLEEIDFYYSRVWANIATSAPDEVKKAADEMFYTHLPKMQDMSDR